MYANITGLEGDALLGIRSSVGTGSVHETTRVNDMMRMQPVPRAEIGPGGLRLTPGALHGMLERIRARPQPGDSVDVAFIFERGDTVRTRGLHLTHAEFAGRR